MVDDGMRIADVVLLTGRLHYRGRDSGVESETETGWVLRFRDGRLVLLHAFRDPEQVLGSVGRES